MVIATVVPRITYLYHSRLLSVGAFEGWNVCDKTSQYLWVEHKSGSPYGRLNQTCSVMLMKILWNKCGNVQNHQGRHLRGVIFKTWATSDCVFKHSATVNRKRVCSSLREGWQNDETLSNSSNYLFKRAIQSLWLVTGCQILNKFKVNRWSLQLRNSVATKVAVHLHEWLRWWGSFSDWIAAILSLADRHELLVAESLAIACSNPQLLWTEKECVHLFMKGGKMMKSCQIPATTSSNELSSHHDYRLVA